MWTAMRQSGNEETGNGMNKKTVREMAMQYANEHVKKHTSNEWLRLYEAYVAGFNEALGMAYVRILGSDDDTGALDYIDELRNQAR